MTNNCTQYITPLILLSVIWLNSCTTDEDYTIEKKAEPAIAFCEASGIYTVKAGRSVTITPTVTDAQDPVYTWKHAGDIVSTERIYTYQARIDGIGSFIYHFRVDASNGSAQDSVRIDVVEKTPPVISFPVPEEGYITVISGNSYLLEPTIKFGEEATYMWVINKETVGNEESFLFERSDTGDHILSLTVINEDGATTESVQIKVIEQPGLTLSFEQEIYTVPLGRSLILVPIITYSDGTAIFEWLVNDLNQPLQTGDEFTFIPIAIGEYRITVRATENGETAEATITVQCTEQEGFYRRYPDSNSSSYSTTVYEFLPAPGQFINEDFTGSTMQEVCKKVENQFKEFRYVSLGGFGGYVVVGFDHSIANVAGEYDFAIYGNSFGGSSEPGIVWVMQDENGNGLPDDTWYELRGSETGKPETIQNYAVTYYKPTAIQMPVQWTDNLGNSGIIEYKESFHPQPYYYPNWVTTQSYTLRGTRLAYRTYVDANNMWINPAYEWGYADNQGSDVGDPSNTEAGANPNFFKIENAMHPNGDPVSLQYIDFIKVQTGINGSAGPLGEISTEELAFKDLNMQ